MKTVRDNLDQIVCVIEESARKSGRSMRDITLVAVTKRQSVESINEYLQVVPDYGVSTVIGESYIQEFIQKEDLLKCDVPIHLIGALQSNKSALALKHFDLIESVHSEKLCKELNKQAVKLEVYKDIYLQINISNDPAKSGFGPSEAKNICDKFASHFSNLCVKGLMTITEYYENAEDVREDFASLRKLRDELDSGRYFSNNLALSMGMSRDYHIAIEEGATHVRIGSSLFGLRDVRKS